MSTASAAAASLCIAATTTWRVFTPTGFVAVVFPPARTPDMGHPGRVIPTRMVDNVLLVVAQVGHVAGFGQPCAARVGAILNLIAGSYRVACYRIAASVTGFHCLNHLLIHA